MTSSGCHGKRVTSDLLHTSHKSEPDPGRSPRSASPAGNLTLRPGTQRAGPAGAPEGPNTGAAQAAPRATAAPDGGSDLAAPAASSSNVTGKPHVDDLSDQNLLRRPSAHTAAPLSVSAGPASPARPPGQRLCAATPLTSPTRQLCTRNSRGDAPAGRERVFTSRRSRGAWQCLLSCPLQPGKPGTGQQGRSLRAGTAGEEAQGH